EEVEAFAGAPQSVYSDQFLWQDYGFKLEVPPVHPVLLASTLLQRGQEHRDFMLKMKHLQVCIALQRDGFMADSPGGEVRLRSDGSPVLDYRWSQAMGEGFRQALLAMGQLQLAAGAQEVVPIHLKASACRTEGQLKQVIQALAMERLLLKVVSAHVMGGACFGVSAT